LKYPPPRVILADVFWGKLVKRDIHTKKGRQRQGEREQEEG
jgi:hypothetical protein